MVRKRCLRGGLAGPNDSLLLKFCTVAQQNLPQGLVNEFEGLCNCLGLELLLLCTNMASVWFSRLGRLQI
jgi:hypothetical protein